MRGIASVRRTRGMPAAAAADVYQHGDDDGPGEGIAAMLAYEGFCLLAALRVAGLTHRLRLGSLARISTAVQALGVFGIVLSFLHQHVLMAKFAAIGLEAQSAQMRLLLVCLRHSEIRCLHRSSAGRTADLRCLLDPSLEYQEVDKAYPGSHPHRNLVGRMLHSRLINHLGSQRLFGQLLRYPHQTLVVTEADESEI